MVHHDAMQMRAPDSVRGPARKRGLGGHAVAHKTYAAEGIRFALGNRDAELVQRLDAVGHQSLAAGFVDRRNRAVGQHHAQTVTARGDRRRQTGRSAAGYEHIHRIRKTAQHEFLIGKLLHPILINDWRGVMSGLRG